MANDEREEKERKRAEIKVHYKLGLGHANSTWSQPRSKDVFFIACNYEYV